MKKTDNSSISPNSEWSKNLVTRHYFDMRIGLLDVDGHNYPNLALMKLSRWHKEHGDDVEMYAPMFGDYDRVYMSKVFTHTPDYNYPMTNTKEVFKGGTGYDVHSKLPYEIDHTQPDYSLYGGMVDKHTAYGFLTRGCPNKCPWCIVPKKEGLITPYMDVDEIAIEGRHNLILMDNNILACDYGLEQIEKIIDRGYRIDFNQAMDARLVTDDVAKLLAKVRWIRNIRFGCDTPKQVESCAEAMEKINHYYGKPHLYLLYTMIHGKMEECYNRINYWRQPQYIDWVVCQSQPMLDFSKVHQDIPMWQKDMAQWSNRKQLFKTIDFKEFRPRKDFVCNQYFK